MFKYVLVLTILFTSLFYFVAAITTVLFFAFLLSNKVGLEILFKKIELHPVFEISKQITENPFGFYKILMENFEPIMRMDGLGFIWPIIMSFLLAVFYLLHSRNIFKTLYTSKKLQDGAVISYGYLIALMILINLTSLPADIATQYNNPFVYIFTALYILAIAIISLHASNPKKIFKFISWFILKLLLQFLVIIPFVFFLFYLLSYCYTSPSLFFTEFITKSPKVFNNTPSWIVGLTKTMMSLIFALVAPVNMIFFMITNLLLFGESYQYAMNKTITEEEQKIR